MNRIENIDQNIIILFSIVFLMLVFASSIAFFIKKTKMNESNKATIGNLIQRINAWWVMVFLLVVSFLTGGLGTLIVFLMASYFAIKEFSKILNLSDVDKLILLWILIVVVPFQYFLIWYRWYALYSIFIPVYAFLFIPLRRALSGDSEKFFENSSKIQWILMLTVYSLSHIPALMLLEIPNSKNNAVLIFFVIFVCQISDVLQYVWGKLLGKHKVAPLISPNKTWEGLIGGVLSAALVGTSIYWATPFAPVEAFGLSLLIALSGFSGGLVMSAIKRDVGIKDYGNLISGHGGVMDRIDSLIYAGPMFFHFVKYFYT